MKFPNADSAAIYSLEASLPSVMVSLVTNAIRRKATGSFYTDEHVARFLVRWAIRSPTESLFDPSFGGGVFLAAGCERVRELGGDCTDLVHGVELEDDVHRHTLAALGTKYGLTEKTIICSDFFLERSLRAIDAVVGNPPFVRYQRFSGAARDVALAAASRSGVRLSELSSAWAPFLVESIARLRRGGRLAMVIPMELCHAAYARPVLRYLGESFRSTTLLSFDEPLFPDLNQDVLLVLAEGKGESPSAFKWRNLRDGSALDQFTSRSRVAPIELPPLVDGRSRFIENFLPKAVRSLYSELIRHPKVQRLGEVAEVGIGYVSGANDYFHVSDKQVSLHRLPAAVLRRAVCRGRALQGIRFTEKDWANGLCDGTTAYLFHPRAQLDAASAAYVAEGEHAGHQNAYKCRVRQPWYRVPHVYAADAFLTYMSGDAPRLVVNATDCVAPNTLHIVRLRPLANVEATQLALGWLSSLTRLSTEIQGHAMGGGMLKLEPTEAGMVAIPLARLRAEICELVDGIARAQGPGAVNEAVDRLLLRDELGLSTKDCKVLREGAASLRDRRMGKTR